MWVYYYVNERGEGVFITSENEIHSEWDFGVSGNHWYIG